MHNYKYAILQYIFAGVYIFKQHSDNVAKNHKLLLHFAGDGQNTCGSKIIIPLPSYPSPKVRAKLHRHAQFVYTRQV